jgi:chromosome partitioning protein
VFKTLIPRSVRIAEAPSHGKPVTVYDPSGRGSEAYRQLAKEVLERV